METKRLFRKAMIICLLVLFTCPSIARRYIPEDLEYNFNLVTGTINYQHKLLLWGMGI